MRRLEYIIPEEFDGERVQNFLRGGVHLSLRLLRSLKRVENGIELNGEHVRTVDIIHKGDVLTLNIPQEEGAVAVSGIRLNVIYEDEDILIVNKPPMLPVHESHNHQGDTLANAVSAYLNEKGKSSVFRAIGRLDMGTSGLVVCALNQYCASRLSGKIEKEYLAVATGEYTGCGTIDAPIYRPDPLKTTRCVDERGDRAVTHYESLKSGNGMSLLRIRLETGRTHQIRVHFASLGTPLVGDYLYGKTTERFNHQLLHCHKVSFVHPVTKERIECIGDMPEDMATFAEEQI
ncbi:MAG: RluA family pseudouridine synthase [Clostridia bacterium]|nr:RluA family pseudouridine synthase [Clostridia bacterium]